MPRNYKRTLGSRNYKNYTNETLQSALNDIRSGTRSQREAESYYKIPRSTLKYKLKSEHNLPVGRPTVLDKDMENSFVQHLITCSDFGFPLDGFDVRCIVKSILDKKGIKEARFANNLPGYDWLQSFLKRNKELTVRLCSNIKKKRAAISEKTISSYFENLSKELKDVPPSNIYNYDETNLSDDPGSKRVITKRGLKYPERILNSTKASISLMFCGNAEGEVLPPYVVYKSEQLWHTWVMGGPDGTRYARTKSGWFDSSSFENWFLTLVLPCLKKKIGKKVLIGDNLSSHINIEILNLCKENNISFICLPPNSTHLTQPLDIAYYRPLKMKWRKILNEHKVKSNTSSSGMPKHLFPKQLKQLTEALKERGTDNLKSGFRKAGIYPLDIKVLLDKLPHKNKDLNLVGDTFMERITDLRKTTAREPVMKRKKLSIEPGMSISAEDVNADKNKQPDEIQTIVNDMEMKEGEEGSGEEGNNEEDSDEERVDVDESQKIDQKMVKVGEWMICEYEGANFPGRVQSITEEGLVMNFMVKCQGIGWKWPEKPDVMLCKWAEIKYKVPNNAVILHNTRGVCKIKNGQLQEEWGE